MMNVTQSQTARTPFIPLFDQLELGLTMMHSIMSKRQLWKALPIGSLSAIPKREIASRALASQNNHGNRNYRNHHPARSSVYAPPPLDWNQPDTVGKRLWSLSREGRVNESLDLWKTVLSSHSKILNSRMVVAVIQCIINDKSSAISDKGQSAEQVWNEAKAYVEPHLIIYNCLINAHSKTNADPERGPKAEAWLRQSKADGIQPDKFSYASVINAYGSDRAEDAQRILDEYRETATGTDTPLDKTPFQALLQAWSKHRNSQVARTETERIMKQLLEETNLHFDVKAYMSVLNSQIGHQDGGERAEEWCRRYYSNTGNFPDTGMWLLVLHAWGNSGRPDAGEQSDRLMRQVLSSSVQQTTALYNAWMNCWTKSGTKGALRRVLNILASLEQSNRMRPDALSYSAAMQSWAKSGSRKGPEEAEKLLSVMQQRGLHPTLQCYEAVMDAYARTENGATRVLEILVLLEKMGRAKVMQPSVRSYSAALLSVSYMPGRSVVAEDIMRRMANFGIQPNAHCYTMLMTCYIKDKNPEKALGTLERIKRPNLHMFTTVIDAFAKSGDFTTAKQVLQRAQKHCFTTGEEMTLVPIRAILNPLRQVGTVESAQEVESIFRSMVVDSNLKPTTNTLSMVTGAWAQLKDESPDHVISLFEEFRRDFPDELTSVVYTSALNAFVKNNHPNAVESILVEMVAHECAPTNVNLTIAIGVYVRHGDEYRKKAQTLLEQMEQDYEATGNEWIKPLPQAYEYLGVGTTNLQ